MIDIPDELDRIANLPFPTELSPSELATARAWLETAREPQNDGIMPDAAYRVFSPLLIARFRDVKQAIKKLLVFNEVLAEAPPDEAPPPAPATAAPADKTKWKIAREYLLAKIDEGAPFPVKSQEAWAEELSGHYGFEFSKAPVVKARDRCKEIQCLVTGKHRNGKQKPPVMLSVEGTAGISEGLTGSEPTPLENLKELELAEFTFEGMLEDHTLTKPRREKVRRWKDATKLEAYRRIKAGEPQESVIDSI